MRGPTNPFALATHLIDEHHQDAEVVDTFESTELRAFHASCHSTGLPDHEHEDRP